MTSNLKLAPTFSGLDRYWEIRMTMSFIAWACSEDVSSMARVQLSARGNCIVFAGGILDALPSLRTYV